ncbi:hypothetical protein ACCS79_03700 [Rhizobium johnstonii]|uniref:hypothetical protein n=1 Tax=Rhizobium johnstonii TaxID=3019933 RepID=UPI003F9EA676
MSRHPHYDAELARHEAALRAARESLVAVRTPEERQEYVYSGARDADRLCMARASREIVRLESLDEEDRLLGDAFLALNH